MKEEKDYINISPFVILSKKFINKYGKIRNKKVSKKDIKKGVTIIKGI